MGIQTAHSVMKALLQPPEDAEFPLFYSYASGETLFVLGGGGAARSGVANGVRAYSARDMRAVGACDFDREPALWMFGTEASNEYIVVTEARIYAVGYDAAAAHFTVGGTLACAERPRRACECGTLVALASETAVVFYRPAAGLATPECVHAHKLNQPPLCMVGGPRVLLLSGSDGVTVLRWPPDTAPGMATITEEALPGVLPFRHASLTADGVLWAASPAATAGKTIVTAYDSNMAVRARRQLGFATAHLCATDGKLHLCTPHGRLLVYDHRLRRTLSRRTAVEEMLTHISASDVGIIVVAVDRFQVARLVPRDHILALSLALSAALVSFLYTMLM